ncbi:MAG: 50S ribosomal protein L29 [Dehalococcoidia bacterium]|nr:50S ribosomal protein L29 [Dehalococcoidia bacterium]
MPIDDITTLNDEELAEELVETQRALMNLRFRVATMQLADVNEIRRSRRRVARIKTIMRQRELAGAGQ